MNSIFTSGIWPRNHVRESGDDLLGGLYVRADGPSPRVVTPELHDVEAEHRGRQGHGVAGGNHGAAGEVGAHLGGSGRTGGAGRPFARRIWAKRLLRA